MNNLKKVFLILNKSQRIKSIQLFFLMLVGMLFETMGVGLLLPTITLMLKPKLLENYIEEGWGYEILINLSEVEIILLGLSILILFYFIKTLFLIYLSWFKNKFSFSILADISKRMFSNYLKKDWLFYLDNNSAKLIRNCNTECTIFVNNIFVPFIELFAEILIVLGIIILLILIEPLGILINFLLFCSFGLIFYKLFRKKTNLLGRDRQKYEFQRVKHLQQGFGAIRDIKILNADKYFLNLFNISNVNSSKIGAKWLTIQQIPRHMLEFVSIFCLSIIVLILIFKKTDFSSIIPILAMFAAASFRLLPSSNRILGALQNIRYGTVSIDLVYNELFLYSLNMDNNQKNKIKFKNIITLKNISFKYPSKKENTLKDISIDIPKGKFIGIIGESGAGKSTLIDIILGLLIPEKGTINSDNENIHKNIKSWQTKIGYVPQDIYLIDDTLEQNIAFGIPKNMIITEKINEVIKLTKLDDFVKSLKNGVKTVFGEKGIKLSGGQLQRIAIARALYQNPEILILDEATSSLDNETEKFVMSSVKSLKGLKTILIIAHRLTTVTNCDYLYKLHKGKILKEGKPIDIL